MYVDSLHNSFDSYLNFKKFSVESSINNNTSLSKRSRDEQNNEKETVPKKKLKTDEDTAMIRKTYGKHTFLEDSNGYVHVYTDGSCEGNGTKNAVAGLGVYFDENHPL